MFQVKDFPYKGLARIPLAQTSSWHRHCWVQGWATHSQCGLWELLKPPSRSAPFTIIDNLSMTVFSIVEMRLKNNIITIIRLLSQLSLNQWMWFTSDFNNYCVMNYFVSTLQILATDYETYACLQSCINYFGFRAEFAWILTKEPTKSNEARQTCRQIMEAKIDFDISKLQKVFHGRVNMRAWKQFVIAVLVCNNSWVLWRLKNCIFSWVKNNCITRNVTLPFLFIEQSKVNTLVAQTICSLNSLRRTH